MVKILVGSPKPTEFSAHEEVLTRSSVFFAAALSASSGFAEAQNGIVELPDIRPDTFGHWLQWAYSSGLDLRWDEKEDVASPVEFISHTTSTVSYTLEYAVGPLLKGRC